MRIHAFASLQKTEGNAACLLAVAAMQGDSVSKYRNNQAGTRSQGLCVTFHGDSESILNPTEAINTQQKGGESSLAPS